MSFFNVGALSGNPFSTPVGQRIDQATDPTLASENWALNIEICDMINESSDTARDAMKAIRKKLQQYAGKNYTAIMYTLTVLETCVKNCGKAFHVLVAQKEFIQELVKLIGPKNDPPAVVQEKVLNLIQIWADTFRIYPELNGVVLVYQELKTKGIEFPSADLEAMAPIYTPQRSVPESPLPPPIVLPTSPQHAAAVTQNQPGSPANNITNTPIINNTGGTVGTQPHQQHLQLQQQQQQPQQQGNVIVNAAGSITTTSTPDQIAKIQSELDIVSMNMSILSDMLNELKPGQEDPSDYKLLLDLTQTCKEMQARIVALIGHITHDEITAELLRLNDELNNLFLRQQRYEKNRDPHTIAAPPSAILGAAIGIPITQTNGERPKDALIDLSDEGTTSGTTDHLTSKFAGLSADDTNQSGAVPIKTTNIHHDVDEFDMLAQSRNTTIMTGGATVNKENLDNIGTDNILNAPIKVQQQQPQQHQKSEVVSMLNAKESDFDEMAAWLEKADEEDDGPEESLTSKEFDRFLAERAAAAENLPTLPTHSSSPLTFSTPSSTNTTTTTPQHNNKKSSSKNKGDESLMAL